MPEIVTQLFSLAVVRNEDEPTADQSECVSDSDESAATEEEDRIYPIFIPQRKGKSDSCLNESFTDHGEKSIEPAEIIKASSGTGDYVEDVNVYVTGTNNTDRRHWDKIDVCYYCHLRLRTTSFASHLYKKHQNEKNVIDAMAFSKNSRARNNAIQIIRNLGNYFHNCKSLCEGGFLIPVKRPSKMIDISKDIGACVACDECFGFYGRRDFWRHKCPNFSENSKKTSLPALALGNTPGVKTFFNRLTYDDVGCVIAGDETIKAYIKCEINKKGASQYSAVSSHARLLAELVIHSSKVSANGQKLSLEELMKPENFDTLYANLMSLFQYDDTNATSTPSMVRPSSFRRIIQIITKLNSIIRVNHLIQGNTVSAEEQTAMKEIIAERLQPLSYNALKSMPGTRSGIPQKLPTSDDMVKFKDFLQEKLSTTEKTQSNSRRIAKLVVARLIFFNKRRASEVSNLKVSYWRKREEWKKGAYDDLQKLTEEEQNMVEDMELVYVQGKGRKFVPILFPKECVGPTEWLSETKQDDEFIFTNKNGKPLRGTEVLRTLSSEAGLSNLCSTKFRKFTATSLQVRF